MKRKIVYFLGNIIFFENISCDENLKYNSNIDVNIIIYIDEKIRQTFLHRFKLELTFCKIYF